MNREKDLDWFDRNRADLARQFPGRWLVVLNESVVQDFDREEEAVNAAVTRYGVNVASVFQAVNANPVEFIGL